MSKGFSDRCQHSKDMDVRKYGLHTQYQTIESHDGNEYLKYGMILILEGIRRESTMGMHYRVNTGKLNLPLLMRINLGKFHRFGF